VHVALGHRGQALRLQVRDWGRGFNVDGVKEADPRKCVGLYSMRERIALLGGHFEISSEVGAGTLVEAEIPLQEESTMGGGNNDS
jgi:signal transduction histidine kinase